MKPQDFDFRLYVVSAKDYVCDEYKYQILANLKIQSEFMERNALKEPQVEVELFTGFKDSKNLKKVFVNDIIKYSWRNQENIGCVVDWSFNDCSGTFNVNAKGEFLSLGVVEILEIIGNIHENPVY